MEKKKILLVDDDELDVISVQRTLKKSDADYSLYIACNGKEALELLNDPAEPLMPDVVLLDLNMPKMNGLEFLQAIRNTDKFKHLRIFIMTTSAESGERASAEKLGISGYIIKPLNYTNNTKRFDSMDAFMQFHLRKILSD